MWPGSALPYFICTTFFFLEKKRGGGGNHNIVVIIVCRLFLVWVLLVFALHPDSRHHHRHQLSSLCRRIIAVDLPFVLSFTYITQTVSVNPVYLLMLSSLPWGCCTVFFNFPPSVWFSLYYYVPQCDWSILLFYCSIFISLNKMAWSSLYLLYFVFFLSIEHVSFFSIPTFQVSVIFCIMFNVPCFSAIRVQG